jgi:hypothetical protein
MHMDVARGREGVCAHIYIYIYIYIFIYIYICEHTAVIIVSPCEHPYISLAALRKTVSCWAGAARSTLHVHGCSEVCI